MGSHEVNEDESTLVHSKGTVSNEEVEELEDFLFDLPGTVSLPHNHGFLLNHAVISLKLASLRVTLVLNDDFTGGAALSRAWLRVQFQIENLAFEGVGQAAALHHVVSDHLVFLPRKEVAPR